MKCELTGFLGVLILVSWWLVSGNTVRAAEAARPNVVIFLADDAGVAVVLIGRPAEVPAVDTRPVCHIAVIVDDVGASRTELEARAPVGAELRLPPHGAPSPRFWRQPLIAFITASPRCIR